MTNTTALRVCYKSLRWRHNEHGGVWNHQPHDSLHNRFLVVSLNKLLKKHLEFRGFEATQNSCNAIIKTERYGYHLICSSTQVMWIELLIGHANPCFCLYKRISPSIGLSPVLLKLYAVAVHPLANGRKYQFESRATVGKRTYNITRPQCICGAGNIYR